MKGRLMNGAIRTVLGVVAFGVAGAVLGKDDASGAVVGNVASYPGNVISFRATPAAERGDSRAPATAVISGDFAPAAQRLVFSQPGTPSCTWASLLGGSFGSPTPIVAANNIRVPRGSSVLEIDFEGLTLIQATLASVDGVAQVLGVIQVKESSSTSWVNVGINMAVTHSARAAQQASTINNAMFAPIRVSGFANVTAGVEYDVRVAGFATQSNPAAFNPVRADICNGQLVVKL